MPVIMPSRLEAVLRAGEAHRLSAPTGGKKKEVQPPLPGFHAWLERQTEEEKKAIHDAVMKRISDSVEAREKAERAAGNYKVPKREKDPLEPPFLRRALDLAYQLDWFERKVEEDGVAHENAKAKIAELEKKIVEEWHRMTRAIIFASMSYEYLKEWWAIARPGYVYTKEHGYSENEANPTSPALLERRRALTALDKKWVNDTRFPRPPGTRHW